LGRPQQNLVGRFIYELWGAGNPPPAHFAFPRMVRSRRSEEMDVSSGQRLYHVRVDPVLDQSGELRGAVYIVSDVTASRHIEEQLQQKQRFEMVGNLAGGVAHDFNNLLTSILGHASMAISETPDSNPVRERLEEVVRAGERAAHLTHQLLAYAGKGRYVLHRVDLGRLFEDMRDLMEASVSKKISLRFEVAPDLPWIEADVRQLQQLLMNLLLNAAEAIGDQPGVITVAAGAGAALEGGPETSAGPHVWLEVRDTGCGMDEATKARIFDPFFTTKFMGRGLGLAAVQGIVRGHRGALEVQTAPGAGSSFRVLLPAIEEPPAPPPPQEHRQESPATILVVDDETMVRRMAGAALEKLGYRVLFAANGREAVDLVREQGAAISLVLLDLTMPVMNGDEALEIIARLQPGLRVIASSGYDMREAARRLPADRVAAFLQKPYTARALADKIGAALRHHAELRNDGQT
jgi:signal transduction histidine kinase/ActR/RegA family two-component response regulator